MKTSATKSKTKRIVRADRRHAVRRQPAIGTICRFAADSPLGSLGLVWNISQSGVSVLSARPCVTGTSLKGALTTIDEKASLPIDFEVAHVKELETGDYIIAGPFSRHLSAAKLKPFVSSPPRRGRSAVSK